MKFNSGNLVNRIGVARRQMWMARSVAVVAIGVAVVGWMRPVVKVVAESTVNGGMSVNDCMEYASNIMCD